MRFGGAAPGYAPTFEEVTLFPGRMREAVSWPNLRGKSRNDKPWLDQLPRIVFVSDMSDSLSAGVSFEYLRDEIILNLGSERGSRHHWLWLSKRPDRMAKLSQWLMDQGIGWPDNLWAGTSVTSQATATRIRHLFTVGSERTIRFLSIEPQVESIDLAPWLADTDWVIQGGESGREARRFDLIWAHSLIERCASLGVPYFLKQLGSNVTDAGKRQAFRDGHAGDWTEWPVTLRVRQMPVIREPADRPLWALRG
jgi:protein gp37